MRTPHSRRWLRCLGLVLLTCLLSGAVCQRQQVISVVGGFGWSALFVDHDGYVVTDGTSGVKSQYLLANACLGKNAAWGSYESDQNTPLPFDCGVCHATGYATDNQSVSSAYIGSLVCSTCHNDLFQQWSEHGHSHSLSSVQGTAPALPFSTIPEAPEGFLFGTTPATAAFSELPGVVGAFAEARVGCEACHGPAKVHDSQLSTQDAALSCRNCHVSGAVVNGRVVADGVIEADGTMVRPHQEWEEWAASPHNTAGGPTCISCHDPHASTLHDDQAAGTGLRTQGNDLCLGCHPGQTIGLGMEELDCIACHMPYTGKLAHRHTIWDIRGDYVYMGDIRSHQFKISLDNETTDMLTEDGSQVALNQDGSVRGVTVEEACQHCHSWENTIPPGMQPATKYTFTELQTFAPLVHALQ